MKFNFSRQYFPGLISACLLVGGLALDFQGAGFFSDRVRLYWYVFAYVIVGAPVVKRAAKELIRFDFANEFFLMSVATIGALIIGEYAEAVAVMLFYEIGELFQDNAVARARKNIKALVDLRPDKATLMHGGEWIAVNPELVKPGDTLLVKSGEKVPLDGKALTEKAILNTSAITGESTPSSIYRGDTALAGSINLGGQLELEVLRSFKDSTLSRVLKLVEEANNRKAPPERIMRKFARYYTPVVMAMAVMITFLPWIFVDDYNFESWVYRAFVFLIIACPCALYVSIPLGYFGGIGAASKNGILFKGADFLDRFRNIHTLIIDKTGTLTRGVFSVRQFVTFGFDREEVLRLVAALESRSNHPVARAIVDYAGIDASAININEVEEIPAHGMRGEVGGRFILAGNTRLMERYNITVAPGTEDIPFTCIHVAIDCKYAGYFVIADEIREDSPKAIDDLHRLGVSEIVMLSGDNDKITRKIASLLKIEHAHGDLFPEGKVEIVREYLGRGAGIVAFAGDGINDAPAIALADVGIAMGAMGSDLAIETADVVIQTDQPSKIARAIKIARATTRIVWQNIYLVFAVKAVFLTFGAFGMASMWEAVFADMGVALAAIFNAIRTQRKKF
jgi:Zn2+/Cd2+-exporting ATPase